MSRGHRYREPFVALRTVVGACLILVMTLAVPASAQTPRDGQVAGSVSDQTGGALVGVAVTVRGADVRELFTDAEGRFAFPDLRPGEYELTAALPGFESSRRAIRVQPGDTVTVSLTLVVAVLEQAVVTAGKAGATDVQSMPSAISAVSSDELTRLAIRTVDQAAALAPSVTFTQNSSYGQLSIRGIGTNAVNAGADPSSAMYLDGVYLARPAMLFTDFLDVERIEVLRGPQGTLYGRNAVGGALNLISKGPSNEFDASARVTAGNLDELRAEARVSGALRRDKVMASLAFVRGRRDGYVRDLNHPEHPLGGDDLTGARAQLRLVLTPRTDLLMSADLAQQDGTLLTFNKILQVKPGFTVDNPSDLREVRTSTPASSGLRQGGATVRMTSALTASTTLVSLTAFRQLDNEFIADADISELDILSTHNHERQHQFSEEVTVSHRQPKLTWVSGVFFFKEADHQPIWVDQPQAATQVQLDPRVDSTSGALFGETTFALSSRLTGILGLRYTREAKDIDNAGGLYRFDAPMTASMPVPGAVYAYSDSIAHTASTPKLGVEVNFSPRVMTYVTATRGFKSGGFNLSSTQPGRGYAPEWAWSYEGGLKAGLLNGRARVNVAAFHMDYTNLQVQTPIGIGVFDIRNAAAATIRGVEVEVKSRIGHGVDAGGHVAWLDATYDRYTAVGIGGVTRDVAGNRLNNAPEWSGRVWAEWTGHVGSRRLTMTADATGQSTAFYTPFNDAIQRQLPYGLVGARAEYGRSDGRWSINAYGRNLTNTDYIMATFATSPVAFGGRPGSSRQVGIQLIVRR
jgi:iron complex outermembrane recepter protein